MPSTFLPSDRKEEVENESIVWRMQFVCVWVHGTSGRLSSWVYRLCRLGEEKTIFSFLRIVWSLFVKPWVSFTWGCFVPSLVEIGSLSIEKKIFKFCQCIFISPWKHLNKLESFLPKDALSQAWFKLAQWFWRRRFLNFIAVFLLLNLNSHHPKMLCAKCGWNLPSAYGEEEFKYFVNVFSLFRNYLPLENGIALHLNKLESPSPKDALCQVWLKLAN